MESKIKKISLLLIIIAFILGLFVTSNAVTVATPVDESKTFNTMAMMPTPNTSGSTGMFPQSYSSARTVTLDDSRLNWATNKWKATMSGSTVYCSDYHSYVRYATYEHNIHYLYNKDNEKGYKTVIQGVNLSDFITGGNTVQANYDMAINKIKEKYNYIIGQSYYEDPENSSSTKKYEEVPIQINEDDLKQITENEALQQANSYLYMNLALEFEPVKAILQGLMANTTQKLFEEMGVEKQNVKTGDESTDEESAIDKKSGNSGITGVNGPKIIVMESELHKSNGYSESWTRSFNDDKLAFIFTACENAYGNENSYAKKYSLNDIQSAYWLAISNGEGPENPNDTDKLAPSGSKLTPGGSDLYEQAGKYEEFKSKGFHANINSSDAQVIANRDSRYYVVGPYSIDYTYYEDISYMKSLTINDNENLVYDGKHRGIELILEGGKGSGVKNNANGIEVEFPKPNQKFFIKFSADKAGFPSVTLNARFEYISSTKVDEATLLKTNANEYQYKGYCQVDGEYNAQVITIRYRVDYKVGITEPKWFDHKGNDCRNGQQVGPNENDKYYNHEACSGEWIEAKRKNEWINNPEKKEGASDEDEANRWLSFKIYVPYIQLNEEPETKDAQELLKVVESVSGSIDSGSGSESGSSSSSGGREYKVVNRSVTIPITMELGGYVWVDEDGGKETILNGTKDSNEVKVPNVLVTLSDGKTTTTNGNGEYRFTNLDPMKQYSVTFTYNGQYYQPTIFAGGNTWGSSSWKTNSNAKDNENERRQFNLKFESIGSSPENYKGAVGYNETFTKQELLGYTLQTNGEYKKTREAVIDDYGNLILNSSSDTTTQKMIQYVKDCMMKAYTFDAYPTPSLFLIDNGYKYRNTPSILLREGIAGISILYDSAYYINLGLNPRQESDLAVKKDIDHVTLEINGQTHKYTYNTLENRVNEENEWDISVRLSDAYYNAAYTRELYKSDYIYKASMYGDKDKNGDGIGDTFGKSKQDELEVYITYKIMVQNQATSIRARVDELVDYYDQDLEYIDDRSYIEIKQNREDAAQKGIYSVKASSTSRYSSNTMTKIDGYDNLYITGLSNLNSNSNNNYLAAGQRAYIYLTFKVKKDTMNNEDWLRLDEEIESGKAIGVGKENIVELNGYSTQYAKGTTVPNVGDVSFTPAGIVDRDSNPGNLDPVDVPKDGVIKYENFEDDTDKAPNLRIIIDRNDSSRVISGNVWEDVRNETIGLTTTGDGIKDNKDKTLINGVTVQLVELMENGTEYVWREFGNKGYTLEELKKLPVEQQQIGIGSTNTIGKGTGSGTVSSETPIINAFNLEKNYDFDSKHDGAYAFKSFMPGKYVVRFIYGDTVRTVTPASLNVGGLNAKSYNGQDYKSTTYQEGITQNRTYTWREDSTWVLGQETLGKVLTEVSTFKADASNNETANAKVDAKNQKGYLYDITASDAKTNVSDAKDIESRRNQVVDYSDNDVTNYIAEVLASHKSDYSTMNDRTQLLNDLMNNTKMTAETGLMVIELEYDRTGTQDQTVNNKSSYKIQNVDLGLEERPKAQLAIDKAVTNVKLTLADGSILFDAKDTATDVLWKDHKAYSVGYKGNIMDEDKFGSIQNIRTKNASKFGLTQLSMDEELMHGATIEITYQVRVFNVGEVDYKDNLFYYTGNKSANAKIVTTKANQVIDYVANNLQFNASNNKDWKVIQKDAIKSQGLVNAKLDNKVEKFNTIIVTENLSKDLVPELVDKNNSNVSVPLVLTQLITSENNSDDLTYRNLVEIVKTSNTVGRRMEYSVVGNQDPENKPQELDSDIAEVVRILPPFGNAGLYIIITAVALVAIAIIIGGTIFIKKKVLRK